MKDIDMYVCILISTTNKVMKTSPQEKKRSSWMKEAEAYKLRRGRKTRERGLGAVYAGSGKTPEGGIFRLHIYNICMCVCI